MAQSPKKIKRSYVAESKPFARSVDNSAFYNSWTWRKFSKSYKTKHPLCVRCEAEGKVVSAKVADHIIPIAMGGDKLNEENIQSLCEKCHNSKSASEKGYGVKSR